MEITFLSPISGQYIIKVLLYTAILHIVFRWILSNFPMHQFNRFILLIGAPIVLIMPLLCINTASSNSQILYNIMRLQETTIKATQPISTVASLFTIFQFFWWSYVFITTIFALLFIYRIVYLLFIICKSNSYPMNGYTLIHQQKLSHSSFFNYVFVNNTNIDTTILDHELAHIYYKHTYDKLWFEILLIFFWWCVPLYFIKQELHNIHEFQADAKASNKCKEDYSEFLVQSFFKINHCPIINSFFHHPLKLRIKMLHTSITTSQKLSRIFGSGTLFSVLLITLIFVQTNAFGNNNVQQVKNYLGAHTNQIIPIYIWYISPDGNEETDKVVERVNLSTTQGKTRMAYLVENNMVTVNGWISYETGYQEGGLFFNEKNPMCVQFWPKDYYVFNGIPRKIKKGEAIPVKNAIQNLPIEKLESNFFDKAISLLEQENLRINSDDEMMFPSVAIINPIANIPYTTKLDTIMIKTKTGQDSMIITKMELIQPKKYDAKDADYPTFKTGELGLQKFITDNIVYPPSAINNKIAGKIMLDVTINELGKVIVATCTNQANEILVAEAKRVILKMPDWKVLPSFTNKAKNAVVVIPVSFVL